MGKHWVFPGHDIDRISQLERLAGVPAILAQLLLQRGLAEPQAVREFLEARLSSLRDPEELPGVPEASERIHRAIVDKRRIAVFGDYDVDGMSATALLVRCLQAVGADVMYYVPNRIGEGYGLNAEALAKLARRGASLVITVDCGIGSVSEALEARRLGLELIITDHHQPGQRVPEADVIVHPGLPGSAYPFSGLCGAGVAFKLAWAVCQRASRAKRVSAHLRSFLLSALGLGALGTVADVVPLVDENRVLVRHGLASLKGQPSVGIAALLKVCGLDGKSQLAAEDIAFCLGPRLNAAGRLGQAQLGVELLATDARARAQVLAEYIDQLNNSRESLERSVYLAAHRQLKEQYDAERDPAFVLAERGWHVGVIGIVAGRLAERYHRPVVVISLDELGREAGTGSGRSIPGVSLHEAFGSCSQYLVGHGGHAAAAGLKIEVPMVDRFRHAFCEYVGERLGASLPQAQLRIDAEAGLSQLTVDTLRQIEHLSPFGHGNPRPLLCASGVELAERPRCIGRGERHLALRVRQGPTVMRAMAFHRAEWLDGLGSEAGRIDIAFRPVINEFRGRRNVEMHLVDWRREGSAG